MRIRILLVDDHPLFLAGIRDLLEPEEDMHVIGEANDGVEAIRKTRELGPDLVIMDISMPNLDGIEATRQIIRELPQIRVLALSIHSGKRFVKEVLDAGAAGYLLKDSAPDELVIAIRKIINGDMFLSPAITSKALEREIEPEEEIGLEPLKTKFIRPKVTDDQIIRFHVIEQLERHLHKPLSLIAAPAGYGKSIAVSQWLENTRWLHAWISLDETLNDLREFLAYFCQAVENLFPGALNKTKRQLTVSELPQLSLICNTLINELHLIEQAFILVLDDYHLIHNKRIHELLGKVLLHPPRQFHLSIITRHDPPLDLQALRSYDRLCEIRMGELSFSEKEITELVDKLLKIQVSPDSYKKLLEKTEGWIVGIRLALYSMKDREDVDRIISQLRGNFYSISEFLLEEVLSTQAAGIQSLMLKTSILDRFSIQLVEDNFVEENDENELQVSSSDFLEVLTKSNLFIHALDPEHKWYRYHHLLQDLLQKQLERKIPKDVIKRYHSQVSQWFEAHNLIEEAIKHSLKAGDPDHAAEIVEQNRITILNNDRSYVLGRWLKQLPEELFGERVELLMARASVMFDTFDFAGFETLLENVEQMLGSSKSHEAMRGEIDFYKGYVSYFQGKGVESEDLLRNATEKISLQFNFLKGEADLLYAMAMQMNGRKADAMEYLDQILNGKNSLHGVRETRILAGLAFILILEGQMSDALQVALQLQEKAKKEHLLFAELWGVYLEALISYYWNDLDRVLHLCQHLLDYTFALHGGVVADVEFMLVLIHFERNESEKVQESLERLSELSQHQNDSSFSVMISSCQARLSILSGHMENALIWLQESDQSINWELMLWWQEIPRITACRVLIAEGSKDSLNSALERLEQLVRESRVLHNALQRIDMLVLKAMAYQKLGQKESGLEAMMEAVRLAEPGKIIRPFCTPDPSVYNMLIQLQQKEMNSVYLEMLLRDLDVSSGPTKTAPLKPELSRKSHWSVQARKKDQMYLTMRENEIINYLNKGLTNREIADAIFVSEATIKKHMGNIFKKLEVKSRFQLIQKVNNEGLANPD